MFVINLSEPNDYGRSVEQQLLAGSTYPGASELIMYLRQSENFRRDKSAEATGDELHCAVWNLAATFQQRNYLARAKDFWNSRREGYLRVLRWLVTDQLTNETNIHSLDWAGRTTLAKVAGGEFYMHGRYTRALGQGLFEWFMSLSKAGHDLQDYLRTECALYPDYIYNSDDSTRP